MNITQNITQLSDAAFYSMVAALGVLFLLVFVLLVLAAVFMLRISRLSKALAATADEELRTKLLQQSTWWPRFRFRTMLVLVTLVAVGLGMFVAEWNRARRQGQIVDSLRRTGYSVSTHYRLGMFGDSMIAKLLCNWVHPDFGCTITDLSVSSDVRLTDEDLASIADLSSLESLFLSSSDYTSKGILHIATLPNIKRLAAGGRQLDEETISALSDLKTLELLELHHSELTGEELGPIQNLPNIDVLSLQGDRITGAGIAVLSKLNNVDVIEIATDYSFADEYPENVHVLNKTITWYARWDFNDNRPYLPTNSGGAFGGGGFGGGGAGGGAF